MRDLAVHVPVAHDAVGREPSQKSLDIEMALEFAAVCGSVSAVGVQRSDRPFDVAVVGRLLVGLLLEGYRLELGEARGRAVRLVQVAAATSEL
jgi:hypothetical protein